MSHLQSATIIKRKASPLYELFALLGSLKIEHPITIELKTVKELEAYLNASALTSVNQTAVVPIEEEIYRCWKISLFQPNTRGFPIAYKTRAGSLTSVREKQCN